jgi:carbamoyl-phosphate synthase large subunit
MAILQERSALECTVLFTCAGRRVGLLRLFRRAAQTLGVRLRILGTDLLATAPALQECDAAFKAPPIRHDEYIPYLLGLCRREGVRLVVPLIDHDLPKLAAARDAFARAGALALVSAPEVVEICNDKLLTYQTLCAAGLPVPKTWLPHEVPAEQPLPLFIKPRRGFGSVHTYRVATQEQLSFFSRYVPDALVQELATGQEYSVDAFCDLRGRVLAAVSRVRLETRAGEVSKSVTRRHEPLLQVSRLVLEHLGVVGPATVQAFCDGERVCVTEINPRFGGGAPLSIMAGADLPRLALELALGREPTPCPSFREGLVMLRYDEAFYLPEASLPWQA